MSNSDGNEYLIVPWDDDENDVDVTPITITLPSREITVQIEVPTDVLERIAEISDDHGIAVETALAERLEINRSRVALLSAKTITYTDQTRKHLQDARGYLDGVTHLDTTDIEDEISTVWMDQLDDSTNTE